MLGDTSVPAEAMLFSFGDVEVSQVNGEDAKTAPFKMVARTGQPISHPFWGRIEHDIQGMQLDKPRVAIDYNHDNNEVVGFANKFSTESGDLEVSGALTPYKDSDRASEIIYKAAQGVPWEASINFSGSGIVLEHVEEGEAVPVNGHEFAGPGYVVRKWPLRGIAICPYGADQWTSTKLSESGSIVTIKKGELMTATANAETDKVVETDAATDTGEAVKKETVEGQTSTAVDTETKTTEAKTDEAKKAEPMSETAKLAQPYITQFGQVQGSIYFASGVTIAEATSKHCLAQSEEIEALKTKLAVAQQSPKGAADAVSTTMPASETKKSKKKEMAVPDPA